MMYESVKHFYSQRQWRLTQNSGVRSDLHQGNFAALNSNNLKDTIIQEVKAKVGVIWRILQSFLVR